MKILVTGKEGQVARCLADRAPEHPDLKLIFAARAGTDVFLDLADEISIRAAVRSVKPDVIVNAAAYTAVDQAEEEPELAMKINGLAPGILAEEAVACGARIIQISTDYVFDGELDRPYLPSDPVNPVGIYGKTKLAGEEAVRAATSDYVIARTAWVYSPYGKNFFKTMLQLADTRNEISVVNDQTGNPTCAYEIADGLLSICEEWNKGRCEHLGKVIHLVGPKEMTWYDFARSIFAESATKGGPITKVNAISSKEYPTKVARPKNSRLTDYPQNTSTPTKQSTDTLIAMCLEYVVH